MKDPAKPDNRRTYDAAFRAEVWRLAEQSRSTQAAARALNIDPKRIHQWQKAAQTPVAASLGAALDSATAAELREWPIFADLADAQASVADYFDYYNHDRPHHSISYQTPYLTHQQLLQTTGLNCPA